MSGAFLFLGLPILLAGLFVLLRPAGVRVLLGMPASEAATYALRIAGMMVTAFGLALVLFFLAFTTARRAG